VREDAKNNSPHRSRTGLNEWGRVRTPHELDTIRKVKSLFVVFLSVISEMTPQFLARTLVSIHNEPLPIQQVGSMVRIERSAAIR
jgi:hypothetical protein